MDVSRDWYRGFFENEWLEQIALELPEELTAQQVGFLVEKLDLEEGARILDLACGHGRITLPLARRGYRMTGLDLSPRSLKLAREAVAGEGLEIEWIEADMREIPEDAQFDGIVNVFTAFGYFEDEAENQRVLEGVARALVPGGAFVIDTINLLGLARRYQEHRWFDRDGTIQLEEHEFDFLGGRNSASWTFIQPDGTRTEIRHSVRTYTPHELAVMLEAAGLAVEGAWGDWEGGELSFDSRRLIVLARKT